MDSVKLTKKQKKGLAFREKNRNRKDDPTQDDHAVPIFEDLDGVDVESPPEQTAGPSSLRQTKRKADALEPNVTRGRSKKRPKMETSNDPTKSPDSPQDTGATVTAKDQDRTNGKIEQRYILFVGNLRFTTTKEQVLKHFSTCDPPPVVRLLTPKATSKPSNKSKGCAFLEFTHRNALQQGLKLHQSELDGRQINVELTAGGGGKGGDRLEKLRTRNKALAEQRMSQRKKMEKQNGGDDALPYFDTPQRHSTTSGIDKPALGKHTWSVGDDPRNGEQRGAGRRGKKHRATNFGTGVNAIPVG